MAIDMLNTLKPLVHSLGQQYCETICASECESQQRKINERPIEFRFVFEQLTRWHPESVLNVGTGTTALPHLMRNCGFLVTAIDNIRDYWPEGMFNRHYHVVNGDITNTQLQRRFDLVTCISVLEHIPAHRLAVRNMLKLLPPPTMTCPYNESKYYPDVFEMPGAPEIYNGLPYVCQVYSRQNINEWLADNDGKLVTQEYWQCYSGELSPLATSFFPSAK